MGIDADADGYRVNCYFLLLVLIFQTHQITWNCAAVRKEKTLNKHTKQQELNHPLSEFPHHTTQHNNFHTWLFAI